VIIHSQFILIIMKLIRVLPIIAILFFVFVAGCKKEASTVSGPTVTTTGPVNNATGVSRNNAVALTFSEAMDPSTINSSTFTVMQGTTPVAGIVSYSGKTATFTPTNTLAAATTYTCTLTTGAKNMAGNALASNMVWKFTTGGSTSVLAVVNIGTAGNYVILAKSAINNSAITAITGDLGLSPAATSYITGLALTNATGYATSAQVTGKIYAADMVAPTPINLTTAVNNMITAYNDAAGRPSPDFSELGTGNIGGKTLSPGLYKWTSTVTVSSDVTISGSATDVWIFQISGDFTMSSAVKVTLNGGALAKNIFWQVAGQVTIGTTSHLEGIVLSMTGITFQTGASMNGRALAQTAVVLDANAITNP
jgi:Ice-binding-like/Bacterial Ig-like domain